MSKYIFNLFKKKLKNLFRNIPFLNDMENERLSEEFENRIISIKERNSQALFEAYYMPKAISEILREQNYLATEKTARDRATAMLLLDISNGTLDEFYRFTK